MVLHPRCVLWVRLQYTRSVGGREAASKLSGCKHFSTAYVDPQERGCDSVHKMLSYNTRCTISSFVPGICWFCPLPSMRVSRQRQDCYMPLPAAGGPSIPPSSPNLLSASKSAWCGAGSMPSTVCCKMRPVCGEKVYVQSLRTVSASHAYKRRVRTLATRRAHARRGRARTQ